MTRLEQDPCSTCGYEEGSIYCKEHCPHEAKIEQEPCGGSVEVPCDNCKYLDGDGCRLVFEQIEYGKASDECPNDNNVSTKNTVSRETFEQVMWERDIAISQLKELGYGFGEKIEPCGDAISRKIISAFLSGLISDEIERKKALEYINELPPVVHLETVTEFADRCRECGKMRKGHWIDNHNGTISCDHCNTWFNKDDRYGYMHYCPYCNTKMESEG